MTRSLYGGILDCQILILSENITSSVQDDADENISQKINCFDFTLVFGFWPYPDPCLLNSIKIRGFWTFLFDDSYLVQHQMRRVLKPPMAILFQNNFNGVSKVFTTTKLLLPLSICSRESPSTLPTLHRKTGLNAHKQRHNHYFQL